MGHRQAFTTLYKSYKMADKTEGPDRHYQDISGSYQLPNEYVLHSNPPPR